MRLFADATGALVRVVPDIEPGVTGVVFYPPMPPELATFDFDDETNAQLAQALKTNPEAFRLLGGVLTRNGTVVTPNPIGRFLQDKQQVEQAASQIDAALAKLDGGTNLTAAEIQAALKTMLRGQRFILRWIAKRG